MLKLLAATVAVNTILVGATYAQPLPSAEADETGFYIDGHIELEYSFSDQLGSTDALGNLDGSIGYLAPGDGLRWGVDLSVESFFDETDDGTAINASLLLDTGFGLISVGAPRSVYDDYQPESFTDRLVFVESTLGILTGSTARLADFVIDETPLGLRYDGQTGDLRYGLSYQSVEDLDLTLISAAMSYDIDNWHIAAGAEQFRLPGHSGISYFLSAGVDYGRFGGQASYNSVGPASGDIDVFETTAFYRPIEPLTLNAGAIFIDGTEDRGVFASAEYDFDNGLYMAAELGDINGARYSSLSLGFQF